MAVSLFKDVIPSLNLKESHLIDSGTMTDKEYEAYKINKHFSFGEDILLANMMNMSHHLPLRMQYDFYFYGLDKQKRYNKWISKQSINNVDVIKEYYGCSTKRAIQYSEVLTEEQIDLIRKTNDRMEDSVSR